MVRQTSVCRLLVVELIRKRQTEVCRTKLPAILKEKNQSCNGTFAPLGVFCQQNELGRVTLAGSAVRRLPRPSYVARSRANGCRMKKEPIHQNLNTSFVNVAALVRYLRDLQFVGSIRLELSSYEADITFTTARTIIAREYDHIDGRISQGTDALKRILIRAREPHGRVHVYKAVEGYAGNDDTPVFIDRGILNKAREMAANTGGKVASMAQYEFVLNNSDGESALVLGELSELLRAIDEILARGRLSFAAAFGLACDAIARDYPFMSSDGRALRYKDGEIKLNSIADVSTVVSAVFAALRPIFDRLRREQKYGTLVAMLDERLHEMSSKKRSEYNRLAIMHHIEDLLDGRES